MTIKNTKEVRLMKEQMAELQAKANAIDTERNKVYEQMRKMKGIYNVMVHSDLVGKCFKMQSWDEDEVEDRHGEQPYWMYSKVIRIFRDDQCLTETFHMTSDTFLDKKHPRRCFSYVLNDRSFIDFYKGKVHNIEYIPISEKEYNIALLKCIRAIREDIIEKVAKPKAKKLLNPNCSTTITKISVTDAEKEWVIEKIKELKLDKETAECFISNSERKAKVDDGKWMNEEHDEVWAGYNTMNALLEVKRKSIKIGTKKLTPLEEKKREVETQEIVTKTFISGASTDSDRTWDDLRMQLGKYFKLKNELKKMEVAHESKKGNGAHIRARRK
jgi:hypothetical protein